MLCLCVLGAQGGGHLGGQGVILRLLRLPLPLLLLLRVDGVTLESVKQRVVQIVPEWSWFKLTLFTKTICNYFIQSQVATV